MIIAVLVLAVLLLIGAFVLVLTDRARRRSVDIVHRMRTERDERAQRAEVVRDEAIAARELAEVERDEATARADTAEAKLAEPPPGPGPELETLWELARLRADWARRRAVGLSTAPAAGDELDHLTRVLRTEVEQLRDDAGIPGTLRVSLMPAASAGEAALVASATSALFGALTRWCDAFDLFVHRWEGRIVAVMVCEGFSGPDTVADETSELLGALRPAGGDLDVDRDPEGRLRARLSVPGDALQR